MYKLEGVICPMVTPLDENQNIDENSARKLVRRLIKKNIDGLFVLGTMGECPMIIEEEKKRFVETVVEEAKDKVPVLVNVSAEGPRKTERNLLIATEAGADIAVVTAPQYYNLRQKEEFKNYFLNINRNSDLPLVLYDVKYTNNPIPDDTVYELSFASNIIGIKGVLFSYTNALRNLGNNNNFAFLQGDEGNLDNALRLGAQGIVPGICTLAADKCVELYNSRNDFAKMQQLQKELLEIQRVVYGPGGIHWGNGHKYALSLLGLCQPEIATTLLPLKDIQQKEIEDILKKYQIT